ncbi:MAG: peptidoglycan-associated lipoprotein Pal [Alphaproteobacteria bacterium]|jgi:peptidoglycan-associated lipoprotein|nr:peptidoglycan-associated lipoprotein Pal [Alphaproteobacteria bacterium]
MKLKNFALLAGAAGLLAACGGSSIVEPADLNDQRVFFAFNSSEISKEAKDNLLGQALYMKNHEDVKVQIAGNCDERGTTEYNLALGARRANAAKEVLVNDGIDAKRISTVSYGKERPLVKGTGEEVWKWNRNATTTVK